MKAESKLDTVGELRLTTSRLTRSPQVTTPSTTLRSALRTELRSAPRPTAEFFLNRSFDNGRVPTSEPSSKRLLERITELERLRKLDQQRIASLESQIASLESELDRLRSMSKQVLEDQKGADLHGLYHELFLTDLRKQVDSVNREASAYRWQYEEHKKELENLRRECHQQKILLRRYREYVADAYGKQTARTQTGMESTSGLSETSGEEASRQMSFTGKQQFLSSTSTQSSLSLRLSSLQLLEECLKEVCESSNLFSLCSSLARSAKKIVQCQQTSVFVLDSSCIALYSRNRNPHQLYKHSVDKKNVIFHSEDSSDSQSPAFRTFSELERGVRNSETIIAPVQLPNRLLLALQCMQKIDRKHKIGFVQSDEILIHILCAVVALRFQTLEAKDLEEQHRTHVTRVTRLCSRLFAVRTHQHFANRLREELPAFMDFEYAGVVFYDSLANQFLTLTSNSDNSFSSEVIRFPATIGLTGEVFASQKTYVMDSVMKSQKYNPEIDNATGAPETRNLMLGCLRTEAGKIVGVLQVSNKRDHGKILVSDKEKLEGILQLLAGIIESCTEVLTCMEVTTTIRSCIQRVSKTVAESEEMRKELDLGLILNQFAVIRNIMGSFSERHAV